MACERISQVHAYHDERLSAYALAEFESHLETCAECSELLKELQAISQLMQNAPLPEISQSSIAHYRKAWGIARQQGLLRIASWLTGTAAAVLVGSLMLWPRQHTPEIASVPANNTSTWEAIALMPPPERGGDRPDDLVEVAQWMADDLSQKDVR